MSACRQALRARPCGPPVRVTAAPSIRWVAARSGRGPDGVGMVTVMCCCRRAVAGGVVGGVVLPAAPEDAAPGAAEGADARAGGRGRGRGRRRSGRRPRGASGGCCRPACRTRSAGACCSAQRKRGGLAFAGFDRDGGLAGVGGERVAGGVAAAAVADLGEQLGGADHAARGRGTARGRSDRRDARGRASPICARRARLICSTSGASVATRREHELRGGRRVSSSPTRPAGARASLASSCVGLAGRRE